jgi:hypothetical protein
MDAQQMAPRCFVGVEDFKVRGREKREPSRLREDATMTAEVNGF